MKHLIFVPFMWVFHPQYLVRGDKEVMSQQFMEVVDGQVVNTILSAK